MSVWLIGTLDTKGPETQFVRDRLLAADVSVTVVDAGVIGPPTFAPDVPREAVFAAAGTTAEAVRTSADRGRAVTLAANGVAKLAAEAHRQGKLTGVFGLGGSAGSTISSAAMQALAVGVPKIIVSTLASGQVRPFVGTRDVLMMHSVVDIAGLNRISRLVLNNAVGAMAGMLRQQDSGFRIQDSGQKRVVAATMFGVTTTCVDVARHVLEDAGCEVLVFHAVGSGGRTMEDLIRDGHIDGVLDITTTELADELVGGILSAGPDRLTAAAIAGVPQVVSVGALDMVNFGPADTVPEKYRSRKFYQHNSNVTLMRTTPEEMDRLGLEVAQKACAARGPTALMLPLKGVSAIDIEGGPFWWPEADAALFQSMHNWLSPDVEVIEMDCHINDTAFAEAAANKLLSLMRKTSHGSRK